MGARRLRFRFSLLSILLVLLTVVPNVPRVASAAITDDAAAVRLLQAYSIVRGDPDQGLALDQKLTRAQAAALFVRSMSYDTVAKGLASTVPFPDAEGHWAAGDIAMAHRLGLMKGDPGGTFRPGSDITYAEVLTVLLRMVKQEPAGPWSGDVIFETAARLGMAPENVTPSSPAIRGKIFRSLAVAISQVPLPTGETILQKYVDSTPPDLAVDTPISSTTDDNIIIAGIAKDAESVTVSGVPATLTASTSRFAARVNLTMGANELTVAAVDMAGNKTETKVAVTRTPKVARIEVSGPTAVKVGGSAKLTVKAFDAQGNEVETTWLKVETSGNVDSFDLTTGTLKASSTTGQGTVTLTAENARATHSVQVTSLSTKAKGLEIMPVNGGNAPAVGKPSTIQVRVVDDGGALVADDFFRPVTLSSSVAGVSITPSVANTSAGIATFTVEYNQESLVPLAATSGGLTGATGSVQFLTSPRILLTATPSSLPPDGASTTTVKASLVDELGKPVTNTSGSDIVVALSTTSNSAQLPNTRLVIPANSSASTGEDVVIQAGVRSGVATISGSIESGPSYSVVNLSLPVNKSLPGVALQFSYPTGRQTPNGSGANITVRVVDSQNRLVTMGSYAFQFTVTTSNEAPVSNGLPEGVDLTFGSSSYRPVAGANSALDSTIVTGRTSQGTASLTLKSDRSGVVTLTPKLLGATDNGYNPVGGLAPAAATTGFTAQPIQITFAGSPAAIRLVADSAIGTNQPGAAVTPGGTVTVKAQIVDAWGTPVPGTTESITLARNTGGNGVTSITGGTRKAASNGVAEFTVTASRNTGYDLYTATTGNLTAPAMTVSVRNVKADPPEVVAVRGATANDLSPVTGYVAPDADYLDVQLQHQASPNPAEPTNWVSAKVYRNNETAPFFTGAVNLMSDMPVVHVPRSLLRPGLSTYQVAINNGLGDTVKSPNTGLNQAVTASYNQAFALTSALYDAELGKLQLTTSGLATSGQLDPSKLTLVKGENRLNLGSPAVDVVSLTSSSAVLTLGALAYDVDPDVYFGPVYVVAEDGWYRNADGSQIAPADQDTLVKPMAMITHATFNETAKTLTFHGGGFTQGTLTLSLMGVEQDGYAVMLRSGASGTNDSVTVTTDSQMTVQLSQNTWLALKDMRGPDLYVRAEVGWLKVGSGTSAYKSGPVYGPNHPVYIRGSATSAQYNKSSNTLTIRGSGYTSATLTIEKLIFRATGDAASMPDFRLSNASTMQVIDDSSISIRLSNSEATAFESRFGGKSVYINSEAGWLTDSLGRLASPFPHNSLVFSVPR